MREAIIYIDDKNLYEGANWNNLSASTFVDDARYANVLCVGIRKVIDDDYIAHFPNLEYILSPSTGLDHIQITNDNIQVIGLNPDEVEHISASSEFAFLLILAMLKRFQTVCTGKIVEEAEELQGKTLGVLGYGRIGKKVSKYAKAMGAIVTWHDKNNGVTKDYVLRNSDIILVAVNCIEDNRHYISREDFAKMDRCPYFVNITRGFVVDEVAMIDALKNNRIKAAALDVVEDIRRFDSLDSDNGLCANVIITPHVAGTTIQSRQKACDYVIAKLGGRNGRDED